MKNYKKTLTACYLGFITQAISANFVPLLFLTFHKSYSIPLSKIALISTCFFFTQLVVDLFCAKFVDKIGYRICVVFSEITSGLGLAGLAFLPDIFANPYAGIITCTIIYATGAGLIEVLVSPIVEACPFENKAATMSLLHSFYCWGSLGVVLLSTAFFHFAGLANWKFLACIWALIPLCNIINFATCPIEHLVKDGKGMTMRELFNNKLFWLFCLLMVCAGSSEIAMAQWASAFVESALLVSKTVGDLAGPCCFAILMGISRVFYGKYGEKYDLKKFMVVSGILCFACYLIAAFAKIPAMGLLGCALCGFSVGIMWPGTISIASKSLPLGGTAMFAFFALAGDLGGSLGPAIIGFVSQRNGENLQSGILAGIGFPLILVLCVTFLLLKEKKGNKKPE